MQVGPYVAREHQVRMVDLSRRNLNEMLAKGERATLAMVAPTGAGKTIYSSLIMDNMKEGKRTVFLVSGRQLVFQKSRKLSECQMPHSIMMADVRDELESRHEGKEFWEQYAREYCQFDPPEFHKNIVISKDTMESRGITMDDLKPDLIFVDEADQSVSKKWLELIDYKNVPVIGMTGTPITGNGKKMPFYERIVVGCEYQELVQKGHLVDCEVFVPFTVELKRGSGEYVKIASNGEYVQSQLDEAYNQQGVIGDIVDAWIEYAENRPTLLYASSVEASIAFCHALNHRGIKAEHVDNSTPPKKRREIYESYECGETKVITNYGILLRGVDFPATEVIQFAVSVNSLSRFLQMCGRGSRSYTNKETGYRKTKFRIIDHGGNINGHNGYEKHGWPTENRIWPTEDNQFVSSVDRITGKPKTEPKKAAICPKCKYEKGGVRKCPKCGYVYEKSGMLLRTAKAQFKEIRPKDLKKKKEITDDQKLWNKCLGSACNLGLPVSSAKAMFSKATGRAVPKDVYPQPEIHEYRMLVKNVYPQFWKKKEATV